MLHSPPMEMRTVRLATEILRRQQPDSAPSEGRPFVERGITATYPARDSHGLFIQAHRLTCGHLHHASRRRPFPSARKSAPCYQCGSGTRTPHDARRAHERWVSDYESMLTTPEGRRIVAELMVKAMRRLTLQPGTIRDMRLMNEMIEAAGRTTLLVRVGKAAKAGL